MPIRIPFHGSKHKSAKAFVHALEEKIDAIRTTNDLARLGFQSGHVHCFWCDGSSCEHSLPPSPRAVFVGYDPTGTPRWRDLASWVVEIRHPMLDRLLETPARPVAVRSDGDPLRRDFLEEFGRNDDEYRIASQLIAGPFNIGQVQAALTLQIVERRDLSGRPFAVLNRITTNEVARELDFILRERPTHPLSQWLPAFERAVAESNRTARRKDREEFDHGALVEQAVTGLDKAFRRRDRRTQHGAERALDASRPTATAIEDALRAGDDRIWFDRQESTIIVGGPKNRIHVFLSNGKHVTSLVQGSSATEERIRRGRWIPLPMHEQIEFRRHLASA